MASLLLVLATLGQPAPVIPIVPSRPEVRLWVRGPDSSPGVLANCTVGYSSASPHDPSRPTVVVVHGINPLHRFMHLEVAERYGEEIGARWGSSLNVLGWDWNGDTMHGLCPSRNQALAESHGRALGEVLLRAGVAPEGLHLIGHSSGCVVVSAAARTIVERTGSRVCRLTLLDPQAGQHPLIFVTLEAGGAAIVVEHFWVAGPSGFGAQAPYANVRNQAVSGPSGWAGFLKPDYLDHVHLVRWHIEQLSMNPWGPQLRP
jgi:hypothetical protein